MNSHLVRRVKNRVRKYNKNFICCFVGDTGSGKTYAAVEFAIKLSDKFSHETIIFGDQQDEFMRLLNMTGKDALETGDVILWDDFGVGMSKKDWYTEISKVINRVVQSTRWRRLIIIVTVPDRSYIDSDTMKLFHMIFEMIYIDFKRKVSVAKPKEIQTNHITGKSYYKYPILRGHDGRHYVMTNTEFSLPPQEMLDIYEKKREKWSREFNIRSQMAVSASKRKQIRKVADIKVISDEIIRNYKDFSSAPRASSGKRSIIDGAIMEKYHVTLNMAAAIKRNVELQLKKQGKI